jgi:hypothetical protein
MAVVDQLNLNVGTEQNPNFVLHDINDKRISTTTVTTATHLLTCNSSVTSIAPITAANLASVLGALGSSKSLSNCSLNDVINTGMYRVTYTNSSSVTEKPKSGACRLIVFCNYEVVLQIWYRNGYTSEFLYVRTMQENVTDWTAWVCIK